MTDKNWCSHIYRMCSVGFILEDQIFYNDDVENNSCIAVYSPFSVTLDQMLGSTHLAHLVCIII